MQHAAILNDHGWQPGPPVEALVLHSAFGLRLDVRRSLELLVDGMQSTVAIV